MEKISSILPSSSRLKSVDLTTAHPVRPGVPTFGRPVGTTAQQRDRLTLSAAAREGGLPEPVGYPNPRELAKAKSISEMAKNFFETRLDHVKEAKGEPLSQQVAGTATDAETIASTASTVNPESSSEEIL